MQLFCPDCQAAFTGVSRCPRCSGLLLMPEEAPPSGPKRSHPITPSPLRPTPAGRVIVGTVVALGLYLGLRKILIGWVFATESDPSGWWLTTDGLVAVFGIQAVAGLFGALLTGTGRVSGFSLGAATGGLCGGLFLAAEVIAGTPSGQLVLYLQPLILAVGGGLAGAVGGRIWASVPELDMPRPVAKKQSSIQLDTDIPKKKRRPTAWARVIIGASIIVAGIGMAEPLRAKAEKASAGALRVESRGQGRFISWQIATLSILLGGAVAGAGTGAGARHGLLTGFLGAVGVVGLSATQGDLSPPLGYLLEKFHLCDTSPNDPATLGLITVGVLVTGLVGGWLGGTILLPLAPPHMRTRRLRIGGD